MVWTAIGLQLSSASPHSQSPNSYMLAPSSHLPVDGIRRPADGATPAGLRLCRSLPRPTPRAWFPAPSSYLLAPNNVLDSVISAFDSFAPAQLAPLPIPHLLSPI